MNTTTILEDTPYSFLTTVKQNLKDPLRLIAGFLITIYYLLRLKPDVLFLCDVTFPQCALAGFVMRTPTVCEAQAEVIRGRWGIRRRCVVKLLNKCDKLFGITARHIESFVQMSANTDKVAVIHNTIDVADYDRLASSRTHHKSPLDGIAGKRIVSYFGGATLIKGYRLFLEIATAIVARRNDVVFVFAGAFHRNYASKWGQGTDPGSINLVETRYLFDWVERHCLQQHVIITGEQSDILTIMRRSAVVIVPHKLPHNSRPMIEAFAVGTPVLATDDVFNRDLIRDGVNGMLAPYGQVDEWVGKLQQLLNDRSLAKSIAERARMCFDSTFAPETVAAKLCQIFESVGPPAASMGIVENR
jgi:glycosyltransferase involved in cell wall biosynthesis